MSLKDASLDGSQAKVWEEKVNLEIKEVRELLKEVREAVSTPAGDDDTIFQGLGNLGHTLDKVWTEMCNGFEAVQSSIADVLSLFTRKATEARENIDSLISKINR